MRTRGLVIWSVLALLAIAGCSTPQQTATPVDVAVRLQRYERRSIAAREAAPALASGFRYANKSRIDEPQYASAASHISLFGDPAGGLAWRSSISTNPNRKRPPTTAVSSVSRSKSRNQVSSGVGRETLWKTIKQDVKHMHTDLWSDTKRVYADPVNLAILGVGLAAGIAIQETGPDDTVENHFADHHHHMNEDSRDTFDAIGNPGTHFALAGLWYLVGQQTGDEKTYEVGKTMASALIINGLTVLAGQAASADRAPNGEYGTFPSGHTSSSFVMASVLHRAYGLAVGAPLYAVAACVGAERVDDRNHYFSDVVMGGVLGTVIGHAVASGRDPEFFGWKVLPYVSPNGGSGIAITKSFP